MKENGFPTREYSLRSPFQDPGSDPVEQRREKRRSSWERQMAGSRCPLLFTLVKYTMLMALMGTLIYTIVHMPATSHDLAQRDMPEQEARELIRFSHISSVMTISLCIFGITGALLQSFSLTLVFVVFTLCRLATLLLIPFLREVAVSLFLIVSLSFLSLVFLLLVRQTDVKSSGKTSSRSSTAA